MKSKEKSPKNELEKLLDDIVFATIGKDNDSYSEKSIFNKKVLSLNAFEDKELARAYWRLDGYAFEDQPAPIFMKLDTLILGGLPVIMALPKKETEDSLIKQLNAENLDYVPIGFMDMHIKRDDKFTVSGLGIAPEYQKKGLSKYLIYGGIKISEAKNITIPTQLSNSQAHYGWLHLAPLNIISLDVFHNEKDTIIYDTDISKNHENILDSLKDKKPSGKLVPFPELDSFLEREYDKVVGYSDEGLFLKK